jgi:hypothetical protein
MGKGATTIIAPVGGSRARFWRALLRCGISGRAEVGRTVSDCLGEFGECRDDPRFEAGVDAEIVVARRRFCTQAGPAITTCTVRSVLSPGIGLSRRVS